MHDKALSEACIHSRAVQLKTAKLFPEDMQAVRTHNVENDPYGNLGLIEDFEIGVDESVDRPATQLQNMILVDRARGGQDTVSERYASLQNLNRLNNAQLQSLEILDNHVTQSNSKWNDIRNTFVEDFPSMAFSFGRPGDGPGAAELEESYRMQRSRSLS